LAPPAAENLLIPPRSFSEIETIRDPNRLILVDSMNTRIATYASIFAYGLVLAWVLITLLSPGTW